MSQVLFTISANSGGTIFYTVKPYVTISDVCRALVSGDVKTTSIEFKISKLFYRKTSAFYIPLSVSGGSIYFGSELNHIHGDRILFFFHLLYSDSLCRIANTSILL